MEPVGIRPRLLTVAVHANAEHQVRRVAGWFAEDEVSTVAFGIRALFASSTASRLMAMARNPGIVVKSLRVIHAVNQQGNFLVSCRVASTLACHAVARRLLVRLSPGAVVVSSDTNPEEIGFASAARASGIPTVFIAHAYPPPYSPPLDFDLSILEGEAAAAARRRKAMTRGEIFLIGLEGDSKPMDPSRLSRPAPVIGIFAPKVVAWPALARCIASCRDRYAAREIVIRWHPSMLERARLETVVGDRRGIVETSHAEGLAQVSGRCDWVIADPNSNVHLQVLKLGVPTIAVSSLGVHPEGCSDAYGFLANHVVFAPVRMLDDLKVPDAMEFYGTGWPERFARYDAAYLRDPCAVANEARDAVSRVARSRKQSPT